MGGRGSAGGTRSTYRGTSTSDFMSRGLDANGRSLFPPSDGNGAGGGSAGSSGKSKGTASAKTGGITTTGGSGGSGGGSVDLTKKDTTINKQDIPPGADLKALFEESDIFEELVDKHGGLDDTKFKSKYNVYYTRWLTANGIEEPKTYDPVEAVITDDVPTQDRELVERQMKVMPERVRSVLKERGLKVNVARRADQHPQWATYAEATGRNSTDRVADGREVGTLSFYQSATNDVFISTDYRGGSVNVMSHEMSHAIDYQWVEDPIEVTVKINGVDVTHTVDVISRDDPAFVKLHDDYLYPLRGQDDWFGYFIGGPSRTNWVAGRAELFAEGLAAYFEGGKVKLREFLFSGGKGIQDQTSRYHVTDELISIWKRYGIID